MGLAAGDGEVWGLSGHGGSAQTVDRRDAGIWSFHLEDGALRWISVDGVEVVRGIDVVFRDENWGTLPVDLSAPDTSGDAGSWVCRQTGTVGDQVRFTTEIEAHGETLSVRLAADVLAPLRTNRSGFSVLLPIAGMAGRDVTVTSPDGTTREAQLPRHVRPDQPMREIRRLDWRQGGLALTLDLAADVAFEMEDQRNWTDASYKIYVRPLALPFPYDLAPGDRIEQTVTLSARGRATPARPVADGAGAERVRRPGIALTWLSGDPAPPASVVEDLARLRPDGLVALVDLRRQGPGRVYQTARLAEQLGTDIHLRLILSDDADPHPVLHRAAAAAGPVASAMALPAAFLKSHQPDGHWPGGLQCDAAAAACRAAFPEAEAVAGMLTCFTEFNRHPPVGYGDAVTFSTSASVHAADDASVMETVEALPDVFATASHLAGGRPVDLGLAALGFWTNPYGARLADNPRWACRTLSDRDPRSRGLFAASWLVRYMAHAARAGLRRVGIGAVSGPMGLTPTPEETDWLARFPTARLRPIYHAAAALSRLGEPCAVDAPARRDAPAVLRGTGMTLVANGLDRPLELPFPVRAARRLDLPALPAALEDANWMERSPDPVSGGRLTLGPYAIAILQEDS